jgi:para-nitrobenzyl esterase
MFAFAVSREEPAMKLCTNERTPIRRNINALKALVTIAVVAAAAIFSAASAEAVPPPPAALTASGVVTGVSTPGVNEFLGIPYAVPPVGALRWMPPEPFGRYPGGKLNANQFGSECTQPGAGTENCLFLNVYSPQPVFTPGGINQALEELYGRGLPVMFWIHGGGLVTGAGSLYDPSQLVKKGVVVVTINYRLGFLGFFANGAIDAEGHLDGNYGFMDQQLALKWVQRNIRAFGGDPRRVTIFGESAGGQSVYCQLASPLSAGLYRAAIAESGSYAGFTDYLENIVPLAEGETPGDPLVPSGDSVAADLGCSTSTCLRDLPASDLIALEPATIYPFVDGTLLTEPPGAAFATGNFNQVPVISGTNHDEYRLFVALQYDFTGHPLLTLAQYEAATDALWGTTLGPLLYDDFYPLTNYPLGAGFSPGEALGASGTDGIFSCPARDADLSLSEFVPLFTYEFADENAPPVQSSVPGLTFPLGAYHGSEVQFLFVVGGAPSPFTLAEETLSATMTTYWTNFAKNLDPNSRGVPEWNSFNSTTEDFESLAPPTPTLNDTFGTEHMCLDLWDKI